MSAGAGHDWEALLATYVEIGCAPETFWDLTPRGLVLVFEGATKRMRLEHADRMTAAWWTANWPWLKDPPTLAEVLGEDGARRKSSDWREIKAALRVALG